MYTQLSNTLVVHHMDRQSITKNIALQLRDMFLFSFFSSEHPVITEVKGIILEQNDKAMMKRELLLLCNTANRHPLKYAWFKDDEPLIKGQDSIKVSLQDDETKYTCQVSNIAGSASRSLVISLMGGPGEKIDSFFSNLYQKCFHFRVKLQ